MAQVLVRNLDDDVVARLRAKAKADGISLEEVARRVLREAARPSRAELLTMIDQIRSSSTPTDFDSTAIIRRWRDGGHDGG